MTELPPGSLENALLTESTMARQMDEMQQIATDYRMLEEKMRQVEELNRKTERDAAVFKGRAMAAEEKLAAHANSKARNERRNELLKSELKRTASMLAERQKQMEGDSAAMATENGELRMCVTDLEMRVADSDAAFEKQREIAQKLEERCIAAETKLWQTEQKLEAYAADAEKLARAQEATKGARSEAEELRQQTEEAVAAKEIAQHTQTHLQQELESVQAELARTTEDLHNTHAQVLESHVTIQTQRQQLTGFEALRPVVANLETKFTQRLKALEEEARQANEQRDVAEERAREAERRQIVAEATAERDKCKLTHQLQSTRIRSEHATSALQREQSATATLRLEAVRHDEDARRERELLMTRTRDEADTATREEREQKEALERKLRAAHETIEALNRYKADAEEQRIKLQEANGRFEKEAGTLRALVEASKRDAASNHGAVEDLQSQLRDAHKTCRELEQQLAAIEAARVEEKERRAQAAKVRRELMEDRVRLERALYQEISRPQLGTTVEPGTTQLDGLELSGAGSTTTRSPGVNFGALPREASSPIEAPATTTADLTSPGTVGPPLPSERQRQRQQQQQQQTL